MSVLRHKTDELIEGVLGMQRLSPEHLSQLSAEQKADLIDQLWASWDPEAASISSAQRAELNRRVSDLADNPDAEITWDELKMQLASNQH